MKVLIFVFAMAAIGLTQSSDVEKAFHEHEVVPDILKVAPKKLLNVVYEGGVTFDLGNELEPKQTKDKPQVLWEAEKGAFYTVLKVDPDAPTRKEPSHREGLHWIVMNIPESSIEKGDEVVEYAGAGPPKTTGLHRYIFLVFKQPNGKIDHNEPHTTNRDSSTRAKFSTLNFAQKYKLDAPEFGNFYQAQYDSYVDILHAQFSYGH